MKHKAGVIVLMVLFFILAQIIGLFVVENYAEINNGIVSWKELPSLGPLEFERPEIEKDVSFIYIFLAILAGTFIFLILIRLKINILWKFWFFIAIFACLNISFSAFLPQTSAMALAVFLAGLKIFRPSVILHNLSELFIYGGLATIFVPLLSPLSAVVLLILISLYDMYAVWKSKHMIELAKFQMRSGTFAGIVFPYKKEKYGKIVAKKEIKTSQVKIPVKIQTAVLGGGDLGFPLIFTGTMLPIYGWSVLIITLFASLGLVGLFIIGKKGKFYPAMPFISAGCFIGYGMLLLLKWFL